MKQIALNGKYGKGKFALVDEEDYEELMQYNWFLTIQGYILSGVNVRMHRVIMNCDKGLFVDHINHNKLDNQKSNLRICTTSQNGMNRVAKKGGTSRYKSVYFNKAAKKWRVSICIDGKSIHLGSYTTELEAAQAYNTKALELFGEFAHINKI
jgi:hypothetical protein